MADKGSLYKKSVTNTPTSIHDARNLRKARETVGSSMLTYKSGQRSRSPILADPNPGSYLEQSLRKRIKELEKAGSGNRTPRTPERYSNREPSPAENVRINPYSPSQKFSYTPRQSQGGQMSFFDTENNFSKNMGKKDRSIIEADLSIIENEYKKRDSSPQRLLDTSKEEEKFLSTLKNTLEPEGKSSPKKIENSPGSARFEEFMKKLKRDKQDFYKKLEQQSRKLSPEVIRNNPYIPQDSKYLDQSIEDLITKRVGSMRMNFKHFQDEFDKMVKRQRDFWQNPNARKSDVETLVGNIQRSPLRNQSPQKTSASAKTIPESGKLDDRATPSPRRGDESARTAKSMGNPKTKNKKSSENILNKKKSIPQVSNKSSQEQIVTTNNLNQNDEIARLRNDNEYLKKRLQDKEVEILKVRKGLHEAQESVLKVRVEKEKENVELMEALEHNRKQREKIENELDKALRKLVKLQKTFNDNAESFAQMKRQYEQFKSDIRGPDDIAGKLKQLEAQLHFQEDTNARLIKNLDEILVKSENETTEIEFNYMMRIKEKSNELELAKLQKEKAEIELGTAMKKLTENELYYQSQIDSLKDMISNLEKHEDQTREAHYSYDMEYNLLKDKFTQLSEHNEQLQKELADIEKNHTEEIQKLKYGYEFEAQNRTIELTALQKKLYQAEEAIRRAQEESSVEHDKLKNMFNDLYREYEGYRSVQSENLEKYKQEQSEEKMRIASLKTSTQDANKVEELEAVYRQQIDELNDQIRRLQDKVKEIERIEKQKSDDNLNRIMQQYEAFKDEQTRAMDRILNESESKISKLSIELRSKQAEIERLTNLQSDKDTQVQSLREELEKAWVLVKNTQDSSALSLSEKDKSIQKLKEDLDRANSASATQQLNANSGAQQVIDNLRAEIQAKNEEVEAIKAQMTVITAEKDKLISEKAILIKEKEALANEKEKLNSELQAKSAEALKLESEKAKLVEDLKKAQELASAKVETKPEVISSPPVTVVDTAEINNLKAQIAALNEEHAKYAKAQESEKQVLQDLNQSSLNKVDSLQRELASTKASGEEAIKSKDSELQALNQKYQTSLDDYKKMTSQLSTSSDSSNSQLAMLQGELKRLQTQTEEQRTSIAELTAAKSKLEQDLAKAKQDLSQTSDELARTKEALAKSEQGKGQAEQSAAQAKAETDNNIKALNAQIQELNGKLSASEASLQSERAESSKKVEAIQQEFNAYKADQDKKMLQAGSSQSSQVTELQNKINELNQAIANKSKDIEKLQADLAKANSDLAKANGDLKNSTAAVNELQGKLQADLAKANSDLAKANSDLTNSTAAANELQGELSKSKALLATSQQEKEALTNSLNLEKQKSDDLQKKVAASEKEKAETLAMLDQVQKANTQVVSDYENKIKQIQASQGQNASAQETAAQNEAAEAKKQLAAAQDENKKLKNANSDLANNKAVLEMNNQQLTIILDDSDKQIKDLQAKLASAGKSELAAKDTEIAGLKKQIDDLKGENSKITESETQAVTELITLKSQIVELQMDYQAKEQGYLKQIRELKKK